MNYEISVIIPAYNAERFLIECIDSIVKDNSDVNCEIIIIDDGSNDGTRIICNRYKMYKNIKYLYQSNSGVSAARNKGIQLASAEYVMFLDSDDQLISGALKRFIDLANDADFILGGYETIDYNARLINKNKCCKFYGNRSQFSSQLSKWLNPPFLLSPWAKIFKKELINHFNVRFREDMTYGEDAMFVLDYIKNVEMIKSVDLLIYKYRNNIATSLSHSYKDNMIPSDILINDSIFSFLEVNGEKNAQDIVDRRLVQNFSGNIKKLMQTDITYSNKKEKFYKFVSTYNLKDVFGRTNAVGITEKITSLGVKNKLFFPVLMLLRLRINKKE